MKLKENIVEILESNESKIREYIAFDELDKIEIIYEKIASDIVSQIESLVIRGVSSADVLFAEVKKHKEKLKMKKECFTCKYKITVQLSKEERKKWSNSIGKRLLAAPEFVVICAAHDKKIKSTDTACEDYAANETMVEVKK